MFQLSLFDVWNMDSGNYPSTGRQFLFGVRSMDSFHYPHSRHRTSTFRLWTGVQFVHIPGINVSVTVIAVRIPDITMETVHIPEIKSLCPEHRQCKLSISWTSLFGVQNMNSFHRPCSVHQPVHVTDITQGRARVLDPLFARQELENL